MKKSLVLLMVCASVAILWSPAQADSTTVTFGEPSPAAFIFDEEMSGLSSESDGIMAQSEGTADFYYDLQARTASGMVIIGDDTWDGFGQSLATGDLNGDGYDDLIVSADYADGISNGSPRSGEVYVFYGNGSYAGDTLLASEADAIIYGVDANDVFGTALACGDVNNDGLADIVIGACWGDGLNNSTSGTGEAYIVFGKTTLLTTMSASTADVIIYGSTSSYGVSSNQLGNAVSIGDINGDNIGDVIMNAPGEDNLALGIIDCGAYYVIYGSSTWPDAINLSSHYDVRALGEATDDCFGWLSGTKYRYLNCLSSGDINCDGSDDLLLGFSGGDGPLDNIAEAGEIRIVYGSPSLPSDIDLSTSTDVIIYGDDAEDKLCVSRAVDVNNNGCSDILVGVPYADGRYDDSFNAGEFWVIHNSGSLPDTILESLVDMAIYGRDTRDHLGWSFFAGDHENNGTNSLMIGVPGGDGPANSRDRCGEIALFKRSDMLPAIVDLATEKSDAIIFGSVIQDFLGVHEIVLSNFDGDGLPEIIGAATWANFDGKEEVGKVFVMQGSSFFLNPPTVEFTEPGSDDLWSIGDSRPISWELSGGLPDKIEIFVSRDGGSSWPSEPIASFSHVFPLSWNWTVTGPETDNCQFKVVASNSSGSGTAWSEWVRIKPVISYGTTVITHGYILDFINSNDLDEGAGWTISMANAIIERLGHGIIYRVVDGRIMPVELGENRLDAEGNGEKVIVFDWMEESDRPFFGLAEAAADVLFACLIDGVDNFLTEPYWSLEQLHFIGHSRGAVINSEVIQRLGYYQNKGELPVFVDEDIHMTTLDPHPADDDDFDCIGDPINPQDNDVNLGIDELTPETVVGRGVVAWKNVIYADNYRQGMCPDIDIYLNGLSEYPGIGYKADLTGGLTLNYPATYSGAGIVGHHSAVHAWYHGTIDTHTDIEIDGAITILEPNIWYPGDLRSSIGFNINQSYPGSNLDWYKVTNGIEIAEDNNLRVDKIFNGDFSMTEGSDSKLPGWSFQGGGGDGNIHEEDKKYYLELERGDTYKRHNTLYIPNNAISIEFWARVQNSGGGDLLEVTLTGDLSNHVYIFSLEDKTSCAGEYWRVDIPVLLRGTSQTIEFKVDDPDWGWVDSRIWIDNIEFDFDNESSLIFTKCSPVDLIITDPNGNILSNSIIEIENSIYESYEISPGDSIAVLKIKNPIDQGLYKIEVVPWANANPDDHYSITAYFGEDTIVYADNEPISSIPPNGYLYSTLDTGSVNGTIGAGGTGLLGVTVGLYDSTGEFVSSMTSNDSGYYQFAGLNNGIYTVSIVTPLGYQAVSESQEIKVRGLPHEVNFELTQLEIPLAQRGRGYWMHQVNALLSGKGNPQEAMGDMCDYMELIRTHFNEHGLNQINVFQVVFTDECDQRLEALRTTISPKAKATMNEKARAHLTALLLNMVSGKIAQWHPVSEDSLTLSQAITYCNSLITDSYPENDEMAKDIAEMINEGQTIPASWIDPLTPDITYKQGLESSLPTVYTLSQNYPNPFNPVTEITFTLPQASRVRLEVFNMLGQEVSTIYDGGLKAGVHSFTWDGSSVASGVYFYRLTAGNFVETKKMVLIK
ncbi:MAG: FG-GAP repeat protein [candidate division Zixibacteria bacterium]|nr:FG-GAP repeat protein [candidate division Zixibacteria bacterium]